MDASLYSIIAILFNTTTEAGLKTYRNSKCLQRRGVTLRKLLPALPPPFQLNSSHSQDTGTSPASPQQSGSCSSQWPQHTAGSVCARPRCSQPHALSRAILNQFATGLLLAVFHSTAYLSHLPLWNVCYTKPICKKSSFKHTCK